MSDEARLTTPLGGANYTTVKEITSSTSEKINVDQERPHSNKQMSSVKHKSNKYTVNNRLTESAPASLRDPRVVEPQANTINVSITNNNSSSNTNSNNQDNSNDDGNLPHDNKHRHAHKHSRHRRHSKHISRDGSSKESAKMLVNQVINGNAIDNNNKDSSKVDIHLLKSSSVSEPNLHHSQTINTTMYNSTMDVKPTETPLSIGNNNNNNNNNNNENFDLHKKRKEEHVAKVELRKPVDSNIIFYSDASSNCFSENHTAYSRSNSSSNNSVSSNNNNNNVLPNANRSEQVDLVATTDRGRLSLATSHEQSWPQEEVNVVQSSLVNYHKPDSRNACQSFEQTQRIIQAKHSDDTFYNDEEDDNRSRSGNINRYYESRNRLITHEKENGKNSNNNVTHDRDEFRNNNNNNSNTFVNKGIENEKLSESQTQSKQLTLHTYSKPLYSTSHKLQSVHDNYHQHDLDDQVEMSVNSSANVSVTSTSAPKKEEEEVAVTVTRAALWSSESSFVKVEKWSKSIMCTKSSENEALHQNHSKHHHRHHHSRSHHNHRQNSNHKTHNFSQEHEREESQAQNYSRSHISHKAEPDLPLYVSPHYHFRQREQSSTSHNVFESSLHASEEFSDSSYNSNRNDEENNRRNRNVKWTKNNKNRNSNNSSNSSSNAIRSSKIYNIDVNDNNQHGNNNKNTNNNNNNNNNNDDDDDDDANDSSRYSNPEHESSRSSSNGESYLIKRSSLPWISLLVDRSNPESWRYQAPRRNSYEKPLHYLQILTIALEIIGFILFNSSVIPAYALLYFDGYKKVSVEFWIMALAFYFSALGLFISSIWISYKECGDFENKGEMCAYCQRRTALTSKHCKSCNKCITEFDHHCKWLNMCVGGKNYKLFVIYLVTVSCTMISSLVMSVTLLIRWWKELAPFHLYFRVAPIVLVGMIVAGLPLMLHLIGFHIMLKFKHETTYQHILNKRARMIPKPLLPFVSASVSPQVTATTTTASSAFALTPATLREQSTESYIGYNMKPLSADKSSATQNNLTNSSSNTATATGVSRSE